MSMPPNKKPDARSARSQANPLGGNADESMRIVQELEAEVEALRTRYEQFFLGLARVPPAEEHQRVRSALVRLRAASPRSAPVRFRLQTLHNRFLSYERMWARVVREREEGTYRRDLEKARMRVKPKVAASSAQRETGASPTAMMAEGPSVRAAEGAAVGGASMQGAAAVSAAPIRDASLQGTTAAGAASVRDATPHGAAPAGMSSVRGAAPAGGAQAEVSDERLRAVYDAYVGAKKRCGEDTKGLTFEGLAKKLRTQIPELLSRHNASSVELKVVIKGGKAMVKAVPK